jgi:asparagine synthase (glutamine-hydrolysing)
MCGIAGILEGTRHTTTELELKRMAGQLSHRGPDSTGVYLRNGIGLAHTRLSILDLSSAGAQPYVEGDRALAYNGELYNFLAIRAALEEEGVHFCGTSDTEVLFRSLGLFGVEKTLQSVRGMFAFAYSDLATGETYLCRDRLGIKPLLYTQASGKVIFASEAKALAAVVPLEVDPLVALFSVVRPTDYSAHHTTFRDVLQVPPGTCLRIVDGRVADTTQYYCVDDDVDEGLYQTLLRQSDAELDSYFTELLRSSVSGMLMSDVAMGAFVSGGVDSSLITVLADEAAADSFSLFTADVVGPHSEVGAARRLARTVGRPLVEAQFCSGNFLDEITRCTYHYESPIITHTNAVPFSVVAKAAHDRGVKPVITGEGSDELFLGYPKLLTERYRRPLTAPLRAVEWPYRRSDAIAKYVLSSGNSEAKDFLGRAIKRFETYHDTTRRMNSFEFVEPDRRAEQQKTLDLLEGKLLSLLHRNDRMGMMYGIESRFPFLDEDVVKFAINLPTRRKSSLSARIHDKKHPFMVDKAPVRRAAAQFVPRDLAYRRKEGFPMSGLRDTRVTAGAFRDGFLAYHLGIDARTEAALLEQAPYEVAKLFAVEVFGRLFSMSMSVSEVHEWVGRSASIVLPEVA